MKMIPRMAGFILMVCSAFVQAGPLDLPEKEQRELVEKGLFPFLKEADRVVVYSLYPISRKDLKEEPDAEELSEAFGLRGDDARTRMSGADRLVADIARNGWTFQGFPILGKAVIREPGEIRAFLEKLRSSMKTWAEIEEEEDCHHPRHAVLVVRGNQRLRFSICFGCGNTFLKGAPKGTEAAVRVFHHFSGDFQKVLEARFDAEGVIHAPYGKHFPGPEAE